MGDPCSTAIYWSGWLELALGGLIVAALVGWRLSAHAPSLAARAMAAKSRTELLVATGGASESSWARLLRAALREDATPAPEGGYRASAAREASAASTRIAKSERSRLARFRMLGIIAAAESAVGSLMLFHAQPWPATFALVAAVAVGGHVIASARRATSALDDTLRALPGLPVGDPPPPQVSVRAIEGVAVRSWGSESIPGLLSALLFFALLPMLVLVGAGHHVTALQLGMQMILHVMLVPLTACAAIGLPRVDAKIVPARGDVVVTHRLLRIPYARTIVPLEIVGRFVVDTASRRADTLAVEVGRDRIRIARGNRVERAARALDAALEKSS